MADPASPLLATLGDAAPSRAEQLLEQHAGLLIGLNALLILIGLIAGAWLLLRLRAHPVPWAARVSALAWRPWREREVLILLGVLFAGAWVGDWIRAWLLDLAPGWGWGEGSVMLVAGSLSFQWIALLAVWWLLRRNRVTWAGAFGMARRLLPHSLGQGLVFLLATLPLLMFYTLLYKLALQAGGFDVGLQDQVKAIADTASWPVRLYFIFLAAVLAPLVEELLFRGLLFPVLLQRTPLWLALTVVSALFALMHGHVPSMMPLFILSFAFCLAYLGTGSLWVPVVMHSLFNLSTVAVLYLLP